LHEHMNKINEAYYDSAHNKEDLLIKLKQERSSILTLLANGKIDEEQFRMLDGKISEYEEKSGRDH
jgi:hypothetical protein